MSKYFPLAILSLIYLLIKIPGYGIRISDSNIYFYTAYEIINGNLLYKDIFFTNFPLFAYASSVYFYITGGNLALYTFLPVFEVIAIGFLIYKILLFQKTDLLRSSLAVALYYFSFITLSTSDHQTGVFLASIFALLAYYSYKLKKFILCGFFAACCILTKAYFLPILLALALVIFLKDKKNASFFIGSFLATAFIVLSPFILFSQNEIYSNIISYSLTRSEGVPKIDVIKFFAIHDLVLITLLLYSLARFKKDIFFSALSFFGVLFILAYKDIYYLYLNFLVPFLCLKLPDLITSIKNKFDIPKYSIPSVLVFIFAINIYIYLSGYQSLQKLDNIENIVSFLREQDGSVIYGVNSISPALAYLADKKLLLGIVDTNENIFIKGFLDGEGLTNEAIKKRSLIVSQGMYYPQYNADYPLLGRMFNADEIIKKCEKKASFPIKTEGLENRLVIFYC